MTGQDITAQTLTQIILEEGKSGQDVIPSDLLHVVLRRGGEVLDNGLGQTRTMLDDLTQSSLGRLRQLVQGPRKQEISQLRQQLRRLEHRLSVLLDDFDEQRHHGNRILAAVARSCRPSGAEIHDPHAPALPFPRTFPASSLRSEAAEPPSLDEAFNM